jgi:hypothetical protein
MDVTESGIVIDVRLEQDLKAPTSMDVTESGIVTDVRLVQSLKAPLLMDFTVFGIFTNFDSFASSLLFASI